MFSFAEKNPDIIKAEIITAYEAISGRTLGLGDPVRLFLETIASVIVQQRQLIDFTGKQNLLAYSSGEYLDALGEFLAVTRKPAQKAVTTLRFTLSDVQSSVIVIPKGTRATRDDGALIFETKTAAQIAIGNTFVEVEAECQTAGEVGNGIVVGQISTMVDPIAYVQSVANTTETSGGVDMEADDQLRDRIRQAPEKFSNAGSYGAYMYWTKTASQDIIDVAVLSPAPGEVKIYPLMTGGALPTNDVIDEIEAIVSADEVRPLTDQVEVLAPTAVSYNIDLTYYIANENAALSTNIQAAVNQAVLDYKAWQKGALGRDINPSELISRVMAAGAKRVSVTAPAFRVIGDNEVAHDDTTTLTFGGFENA